MCLPFQIEIYIPLSTNLAIAHVFSSAHLVIHVCTVLHFCLDIYSIKFQIFLKGRVDICYIYCILYVANRHLEVRVLRANSDVCRRDKVHAAADAGAVHGRYDGLPAPLQVRDARLGGNSINLKNRLKMAPTVLLTRTYRVIHLS